MAELDWYTSLTDELKETLERRGFDPALFDTWKKSVERGEDTSAPLEGTISPVSASETFRCPARQSEEGARLSSIGEEALRSGQVAVCVLAGGMATRMGGLVKALVEVGPGKHLLDWRIDELERVGERFGHAPPLWLMTSLPTNEAITEALHQRGSSVKGATFEQNAALRLTPEGQLWTDEQGRPGIYATGHGDLPHALQRSGLITPFIESGGRYVWISNIDNVGASVDPLVLGNHIDKGKPLQVELVDATQADRGGRPVFVDGKPMIVEDFRFPDGVDPQALPTFNTNTFLVNAEALNCSKVDWTYFRVTKKVGQADVVQFERLLGELSVELRPSFIIVPRDGNDSRFDPLKTKEDLIAFRAATCASAPVGVDSGGHDEI